MDLLSGISLVLCPQLLVDLWFGDMWILAFYVLSEDTSEQLPSHSTKQNTSGLRLSFTDLF